MFSSTSLLSFYRGIDVDVLDTFPDMFFSVCRVYASYVFHVWKKEKREKNIFIRVWYRKDNDRKS